MTVNKTDEDIYSPLAIRGFRMFKSSVNNMSMEDFMKLEAIMYRTFNFINAIEDMDIPEVNDLQDEPIDANVGITSKELHRFFYNVLNIDIE